MGQRVCLERREETQGGKCQICARAHQADECTTASIAQEVTVLHDQEATSHENKVLVGLNMKAIVSK